MDFVVQSGGELLSSTLGALRCSLIDRRTRKLSTTTQNAKGKQKLFLYSKQASSTSQVLETKRFYSEDSHSRLSKRETCVNLFQSIKNLSVLLEGFSQLTIQDRPCLVTQIVCSYLRKWPELLDCIEQYVLLMDLIDFQNRTVRIELRRVNQDMNILETSQTYSSRASKVSCLRTGVTLRQVCQVLTPSGCPR